MLSPSPLLLRAFSFSALSITPWNPSASTLTGYRTVGAAPPPSQYDNACTTT
ncbi:hypothetical protein SOVF_092880 [Spinacia oleracea]|nr:hypothetical protein SOVF_092880 [Spinacia oleracea]